MPDCSAIQANLIPTLHADSLANLTAAAQADLYRSFNAALRALGKLSIFARADAALTITAATPTVTLPTRHIQTLYAATRQGADPWEPMAHVARAQLEALDAQWSSATTAEAPELYLEELEGHATMRVYPTPDASAGLTLVYLERPADVSVGSPTFTAPSVIEDYLYYYALRDARSKNADEAMPDVAAFCSERLAMLEQAFTTYWG